MKLRFILPLMAFLATTTVFAQSYKVVGVADGDTATVLSQDRKQLKCRLFGIDAPEKDQAHGQVAKQSLSDLIYGRTVEVEVVDTDHYGRSVCRIRHQGQDINRAQVARGMAWVYTKFNRDRTMIALQEQAKEQRKGLWQAASPTPPWEFRRGKRAK